MRSAALNAIAVVVLGTAPAAHAASLAASDATAASATSSAPVTAAPAGARHRLGAADVLKAQVISEPQVSRDGRWVAYIVSANDLEADEARSAVWMASWDGRDQLPLSRPAAETRKPRWSPDGCCLAWLSTPPGGQGTQVMLLDRRGGESRAITKVKGEVRDFAFSPEGHRLVLVVSPEQPAGTHPSPLVIDAWHFKSDADGYLHEGVLRQLALLDVASGRLDMLDTEPGIASDLPVWSPDGRSIAYIRTKGIGTDPDGREEIALIAPTPGAQARKLARVFAPNNQRLAFTPDSGSVLYLEGLEPRLNAYMQDKLWRIPVAGGAAQRLAPQLDRQVTGYCIETPRSILVTIEDDRRAYAAHLDTGSGRLTPVLANDAAVVSSPACAGGRAAVLRATDSSPAEVHVLEPGRLRPLTRHNAALVDSLELGHVEDVSFRSHDGTEVHGLMVKPPDWQPGRRYPLLLWIHGGPNGQDEHGLELDGYLYAPQLFAGRGFVVLRVNYRGGSGRGLDYAKAIVADWGHLEVEDLLAGVDWAVAQGIADPERLAIGGWSYGGILTDYTIASDTRFKAAVSGAGSGNQLSTYGSDQYVLQYDNELGPPWQNTALWLKVSYPFFHAHRIRTPTLFVGGQQDFNVPIIGSEQMYQALRTLGVPTQLAVYPGEHHVFTRPSFVRDLVDRTGEWIERYLGR